MVIGFSLTVDCGDADRLTAFWAGALGYRLKEPPAGFDDWGTYFRSIGVPEHELRGSNAVYLVDPDGVGPSIFFQEVPEPKVAKNRVHLDLDVSDGRDAPLETRKRQVDAAAERLIGLGGTRLTASEEIEDRYFVVMQDPEGNEFCLR